MQPGGVQLFDPVETAQIKVNVPLHNTVPEPLIFNGAAVDGDLGILIAKAQEQLVPDIRTEQTQIEDKVLLVFHKGKYLLSVFQCEKGLFYITFKRLAISGKSNVASFADKKGSIQLFFQLFDGGAEGGLGNMQKLGCFCHVLFLCQQQKILQLEQFHKIASNI